jgi:endoglucanase
MKIQLSRLPIYVLFLILSSFSYAQSAVIINDSSQENPLYACINNEKTEGTVDRYNLIPKGQSWLDEKHIGKIHYEFSFDSSCERLYRFSWLGMGNQNVYAYTYSGKTGEQTGWDKGFPSYITVNESCGPTIQADKCLTFTYKPVDFKSTDVRTFSKVKFRGVNIPGFEYPTGAMAPLVQDLPYYVKKGMNTFRLPVRWEFFQPDLNKGFDEKYAAAVKKFVDHATSRGATVILDVHNYMRYDGKVIDVDGPVKSHHFAALWSYLAKIYKDNPRVIFNLMNEPFSMDTALALSIQKKAMDAIRATGATNLILVSGTDWSHLISWVSNGTQGGQTKGCYDYGKLNGDVFVKNAITDSNFAYDVHMYYYVEDQCKMERVQLMKEWLKKNNARAFIGEIAVDRDDMRTHAQVDEFLTMLEQNPDQFIGWTIWAGDSRLPKGDYDNQSVYPLWGEDAPSMKVFEKHLK